MEETCVELDEVLRVSTQVRPQVIEQLFTVILLSRIDRLNGKHILLSIGLVHCSSYHSRASLTKHLQLLHSIVLTLIPLGYIFILLN